MVHGRYLFDDALLVLRDPPPSCCACARDRLKICMALFELPEIHFERGGDVGSNRDEDAASMAHAAEGGGSGTLPHSCVPHARLVHQSGRTFELWAGSEDQMTALVAKIEELQRQAQEPNSNGADNGVAVKAVQVADTAGVPSAAGDVATESGEAGGGGETVRVLKDEIAALKTEVHTLRLVAGSSACRLQRLESTGAGLQRIERADEQGGKARSAPEATSEQGGKAPSAARGEEAKGEGRHMLSLTDPRSTIHVCFFLTLDAACVAAQMGRERSWMRTQTRRGVARMNC